MKRILIVTPYALPHQGGIEVVADEQAKELCRRGHRVTIITSAVPRNTRDSPIKGLRIIRIPAWNPLEYTIGVPYPFFAPALWRTIRAEARDADIVHAHGGIWQTTLAAASTARALRKPFVITEHVEQIPYSSGTLRFIQRAMYRLLAGRSYNSAGAILVLNQGVRAHIQSYGVRSERIRTTLNGVDPAVFKPATRGIRRALRKKHGLPLDKPIILFVGRLVEKKRWNVVADAAETAYVTLIVGNGTPPANPPAHVRYLPAQPHAILSELYRASDLFVLPSVGEGFPLTVQEAMMSGLPVITTDDPNYDAYLNHTGVVRVTPTVAAVRAAIREVLKNPRKRAAMSAYSRKTASTSFSWKHNVDDLLDAYAQAEDNCG